MSFKFLMNTSEKKQSLTCRIVHDHVQDIEIDLYIDIIEQRIPMELLEMNLMDHLQSVYITFYCKQNIDVVKQVVLNQEWS